MCSYSVAFLTSQCDKRVYFSICSIWADVERLTAACDRKKDDVKRLRRLRTEELHAIPIKKAPTACRAGPMTHQRAEIKGAAADLRAGPWADWCRIKERKKEIRGKKNKAASI